MSAARNCDAIECVQPVGPGKFMCLGHWRMVPVATQDTINTQYRKGRRDFAFLHDPVYLQACVDAIDGIAAAEGKSGFNTYLRHLVSAKRKQQQANAA